MIGIYRRVGMLYKFIIMAVQYIFALTLYNVTNGGANPEEVGNYKEGIEVLLDEPLVKVATFYFCTSKRSDKSLYISSSFKAAPPTKSSIKKSLINMTLSFKSTWIFGVLSPFSFCRIILKKLFLYRVFSLLFGSLL